MEPVQTTIHLRVAISTGYGLGHEGWFISPLVTPFSILLEKTGQSWLAALCCIRPYGVLSAGISNLKPAPAPDEQNETQDFLSKK